MPLGAQGGAIGVPDAQRLLRARVERNEPLLVALPRHPHDACVQVHILDIQPHELAQTQA